MSTDHPEIPADLLEHLLPDERICYGAALTEQGFVGDVDTLVVSALYRVALARRDAAGGNGPGMNKPAPVTHERLVETLEFILAHVKAKDSFEGSFEYMMPGPEDVDEHADPRTWPYAMVVGAVRTGNSMGQGGVTFIGGGLGHG